MTVADTVRRGALTEEALRAALASERADGREPSQLAVGSSALERVALHALRPHGGTLDDLCSVLPNVIVDDTFPPDAWALRES